MPWRDPRWFAESDRRRAAPLPPVPTANVRAGRFSLSRPDRSGERSGGRRTRIGGGTMQRLSLDEGDSRMNAITMTVPQARATTLVERLSAASLLGFVAALQVSIVAGPGPARRHARVLGRAATSMADPRPSAPPFFALLLAYGALTLVASAFSIDPPRASSTANSSCFLRSCPPSTTSPAVRAPPPSPTSSSRSARQRRSSACCSTACCTTTTWASGRRARSAHYMTYSGLLMLVICAAAARLVFGSRDRIWPALVMPALVVALVADVHAERMDRRLRRGRAAVRAEGFPADGAAARHRRGAVRHGARGLHHPSDLDIQRAGSGEPGSVRHDRDRRAHDRETIRSPASGPTWCRACTTSTGPTTPSTRPTRICTTCRCRSRPSAASRRLRVWLGFVAVVARALFRLFRRWSRQRSRRPRRIACSRRPERVLAAAALASLAAMLAAGLFEYNFGDSEFLMLFLVSDHAAVCGGAPCRCCRRSRLTGRGRSPAAWRAPTCSSSATPCSTSSSRDA